MGCKRTTVPLSYPIVEFLASPNQFPLGFVSCLAEEHWHPLFTLSDTVVIQGPRDDVPPHFPGGQFSRQTQFYLLWFQVHSLHDPSTQTSKLASKHQRCLIPRFPYVPMRWKLCALQTAHPSFQVQVYGRHDQNFCNCFERRQFYFSFSGVHWMQTL